MSYTGPRKVTYLFIDGGYLRRLLENMARLYFGGERLTLDFKALSRGFTKTFYYDCLAPQRKGEEAADYTRRCELLKEHFDHLRMIDGWHVFQGALAGLGHGARQKQVDIQIAVDMLTHTSRQNMHELDFIAGDQDFKPLIDALVREGMYVRLWYERSSVSRELLAAADARRLLDVFYIHSLLPKSFQERWQLPTRSHENERITKGALRIEHATANGREIELFRLPNTERFAIVEDDLLNPGRFFHHQHADVQYLKAIYSSLEGPIEWVAEE